MARCVPFDICYWNRKQQQFIRVARVTFAESVELKWDERLELVFGIFNGQEYSEGVEIKYFFNPKSLRSMSVGDLVHMVGNCAYSCAEGGWKRDNRSLDNLAYDPYISFAEKLLREEMRKQRKQELHLETCPRCKNDVPFADLRTRVGGDGFGFFVCKDCNEQMPKQYLNGYFAAGEFHPC